MKPSRILVKAGWVIKEYGHLQGQFGNPDEGFCTLGALIEAEALLGATVEDRSIAAVALEKRLQEQGFADIAQWNDAPERTEEEVMRALLLTASTLRKANS